MEKDLYIFFEELIGMDDEEARQEVQQLSEDDLDDLYAKADDARTDWYYQQDTPYDDVIGIIEDAQSKAARQRQLYAEAMREKRDAEKAGA